MLKVSSSMDGSNFTCATSCFSTKLPQYTFRERMTQQMTLRSHDSIHQLADTSPPNDFKTPATVPPSQNPPQVFMPPSCQFIFSGCFHCKAIDLSDDHKTTWWRLDMTRANPFQQQKMHKWRISHYYTICFKILSINMGACGASAPATVCRRCLARNKYAMYTGWIVKCSFMVLAFYPSGWRNKLETGRDLALRWWSFSCHYPGIDSSHFFRKIAPTKNNKSGQNTASPKNRRAKTTCRSLPAETKPKGVLAT